MRKNIFSALERHIIDEVHVHRVKKNRGPEEGDVEAGSCWQQVTATFRREERSVGYTATSDGGTAEVLEEAA